MLAHLKVRTPLVWVTTDEPRRVINDVAFGVADREVFRMDVIDGLLKWSHDKDMWLKVLVEASPDNWQPCFKMEEAIQHVYAERGIFLLEHAHQQVEALVVFLNHVSRTYVDAFFEDDADKLPASFVMISCKDEVPPEIARDTIRLRYELPGPAEIEAMIRHIGHRAGINYDKVDLTPKVRAALGMSEFEFAQAAALSLTKTKKIDHEFINQIKLDNIKAGGLLEIRQPQIRLEDIGGLDQAKQLFQRVAYAWKNPEESRKYGLEPLRRILLVGVPGAGKSAICEAASNALGLELAKFGTSQMMNKYVGESEANMRKAFAQVHAMKPLCLWIDEFGRDMSGGQSSSNVDGGTTDRVHGEFLTGLQELPPEVFLVCAANRIDGLPPEMLRADRFDKVMFVGFPTFDERVEIFRIHLGEHAKSHDLAKLAAATPRYTGAEIKALIKEVRFRVVGDHARMPNTADILEFAPKMKGRVWMNHQEAIIEMYKKAKLEWDWASTSQEEEADGIIGGASAPAHPVSNPKADAARGAIGNIFGDALKGK